MPSAARFIRRHERAVCGLLPESVKACAREGLVSLEVVAGDGTKLKASAPMDANVTAGELEAQIAAEVTRWAAECLAADDGDAAAAGPRAASGGSAGGAMAGKAPKRAAQLSLRAASHNLLKAIKAATARKTRQARPVTAAA